MADGKACRGEHDSIDHTFIHHQFTILLFPKVLVWFNDIYDARYNHNIEEQLFRFHNSLQGDTLMKKFSHAMLCFCCYVKEVERERIVSPLSYFITENSYDCWIWPGSNAVTPYTNILSIFYMQIPCPTGVVIYIC